MTIPTLIRHLHTAIADPTLGAVVPFTQVWERHASCCDRIRERLLEDFHLTDLAEVCDRHLVLFEFVERTMGISPVLVPAPVIDVQRSLAAAIDRTTSPEELVALIRDSPHFARTLHTRVRETGGTNLQPLMLALSMLEHDQDALVHLVDVFTPAGEHA